MGGVIKVYNRYEDVSIPVRMTEGSAGIDLYAPQDIFLPPGCEMMLDTGLVIDCREIEGPLFATVLPRSSAACKYGLHMKNHVPVIDKDYCGEGDYIMLMLQRDPIRPQLYAIKDGSEVAADELNEHCKVYYNKNNHKTYLFEARPQPDLIYKKGERFAQLILLPFIPAEVREMSISELGTGRGGVGSTGVK